jgi:hypothetical protein
VTLRAVAQTTGGGSVSANPSLGSASPAVNASTGVHTITAGEFDSLLYVVSGLTGDATHTTPSMAAIIAGFSPAATVGSIVEWRVANTTAFVLTLAGGTGVTFVGSAVVDPATEVEYMLTIVSAVAGTLTRLFALGIGA